MSRRLVMFLVAVAVTVGLDQSSKAWARGLPTMPAGCSTDALATGACRGVPQPVIDGYWDWERAANPGAAFSSFAGAATAQLLLALLAAAALIAVGVLAARTRPDEFGKRLGYALIGGGALGNLIDRARDGAVTDFIAWHVHAHRWPVFNVADAALVLGIGVLLWQTARARPLQPA